MNTLLHRISSRNRLVAIISLLLGAGFIVTSLVSYYVSRNEIRDSIINTELPLTSDNVYSEIQKDLVRPILISSMMARDTFLRDWVLSGEHNVDQMTRYLNEIKEHYGAMASFFVSENTRTYYSVRGVLKQIREDDPRDAWYFRVRNMKEAHEINVDPDMANRDAMTIFINYRTFDYKQNFIGATGVGLTVDTVNRLIDDYQERYGRTIFLSDDQGKITLRGKRQRNADRADPSHLPSILDIDGLRELAPTILKASSGSFEYQSAGQHHFLNVRYIPELKWFLFVDKPESKAFGAIQNTLLLNLLLCLTTTAVVLWVVNLTVNRYQRQLEVIATTDRVTGLANRHALDILLAQKIREASRQETQLSAIMIDIDHFKTINDSRGHLAGDRILGEIAQTLRASLRASDIACRWGGEEFLVSLANTDIDAATQVACALREKIEKSAYIFENEPLHVTVSAGVALYRAGESADEFVARADSMLYRAKEEGRNRVCREPRESA